MSPVEGLGKTAQVATAIRGCHNALIVCPRMVCDFWADELIRWGDAEPHEILVYTPEFRHDDDFFIHSGIRYFITYWESLRLHKTKWLPKVWDYLVVDEAHRAKGRNTQQSRIIRGIKAQHKYALTGTPIVNKPDDLWPILNMFDSKTFGSYWTFFEQHILAVPKPFGGFQVLGVRDPQGFKAMLSRYMLRRLKADVLPQLPAKQYTTLKIALSKAQRKAYDDLKTTYLAQIGDDDVVRVTNGLTLMVRLRQIASGLHLVSGETDSTKLDAAVEFIQDRNGSPLVVFTQFIGMAQALHLRLQKLHISSALIIGEVPQSERTTLVSMFQAGKIQVAILTLAVGGEGITLTRADTILYLEKSWSPAQQLQSEDRIHRIGQNASSVHIVDLQTIDTVEQRIARALKVKDRLAQQVYTGKELKELL